MSTRWAASIRGVIRTSRLQSRRFGLGFAAATLISALLLAGCGSAEAGAAAVVGDRRISVASVQSGYQGMVALTGPDYGWTQSLILNYMMLEPYLAQAASNLGRGVSTHDAELQFNGSAASTSPPPRAAVQVMHALQSNAALRDGRSEDEINATYKGISDQLKAAGVHVNPRYGAGIDYSVSSDTMLTILPERQDWITSSTPAPSATAPGGTGQSEPAPTP